MEKNSVVIGVILLIAGLFAGYALAPKSGSQNLSGSHMMQNGGMMNQNIDQHFIVQMIPHHEGAIEMAKLALQKSKNPELLSLANTIISAQEKEITDMKSWYGDWYGGIPPQGGMGMMHMDGMTGDLTVLGSLSGTSFDQEFIRQMIPHHEMAIMMAEMLRAGTTRPEMKQLAENIISSQSSEIQTMRGWLQN